MGTLSSKLRKWADPASGQEGLIYWCQGCKESHTIRTKGPGAWSWNGDVERPVFGPSVLVTGEQITEEGWAMIERGDSPPGGKYPSTPLRCHTFVGCNGAQPGEVIFLSDCTHELAGTVQPLPDLPDWMRS